MELLKTPYKLFCTEIYIMRSKITLKWNLRNLLKFFAILQVCSQPIPQKPLPIEVALLRKRNLKNRTKFRITNLSTTAVAKFAIFHFRVATYDRFDIPYNFHYKYLVLYQIYYMNLLLDDILYTILV